MPQKTLSEKVDDLRETLTSLSRQADQFDAELTRLVERVVLLERHVDQLRLESVGVRQELNEVRKSGDEWGRRLWGVAQVLIGAAVGGLITYLVKR